MAAAMWHDLMVAVALMLVLEGVLPFLSPDGFKNSLRLLGQLDDASIRYGGLACMVVGVLLLYLVN